MEYAEGGELFDKLVPDVGMPEKEAQNYFRQLICGVQFLHSKVKYFLVPLNLKKQGDLRNFLVLLGVTSL